MGRKRKVAEPEPEEDSQDALAEFGNMDLNSPTPKKEFSIKIQGFLIEHNDETLVPQNMIFVSDLLDSSQDEIIAKHKKKIAKELKRKKQDYYYFEQATKITWKRNITKVVGIDHNFTSTKFLTVEEESKVKERNKKNTEAMKRGREKKKVKVATTDAGVQRFPSIPPIPHLTRMVSRSKSIAQAQQPMTRSNSGAKLSVKSVSI